MKANVVDVFVLIYDKRKMEPVEIVLRRRRTMRENDGGGKSN
jgi:hypothetical protein